MKRLISIMTSVALLTSLLYAPTSFAATPTKPATTKTTTKTTTTATKTTTTATKTPAAPTPEQVKNLVSNFYDAIRNGNEKALYDSCFFTEEEKELYQSMLLIMQMIKNSQKHYVNTYKVTSVKPLAYDKANNAYPFNVTVVNFLAIDSAYQLQTDNSNITLKYDPSAKKYKLFIVEPITLTKTADIRTSPYYQEFLQAISSFGQEYIELVKAGKQPEVSPTAMDAADTDINLIGNEKLIPVQYENVELKNQMLHVNTSPGQTASITLDLSDFVEVFYSIDVYPVLPKNMPDPSVEIQSNEVSSGSGTFTDLGFTYELFEDSKVKLIFTATEPFDIAKLILIKN